MFAANHFQTPGLKDDPRNKNYIAESTSVSRYARMAELLRGVRGKLNPAGVAELLRDRNLPGGIFAGNGHRATLNAFIATHATIMDLSDGIFWAASPPNQLGKFVAFDVQNFDRELPDRGVAADPVLASGQLERTRQAQKALAEGRRALNSNDPGTALLRAEEAERLNAGFYQNAALRGRALLAAGRNAEAAQAFTAALAAQPAFLSERQRLQVLLKQAQQDQKP